MNDVKQLSLRNQIKKIKRSFLQFSHLSLENALCTQWLNDLAASVPTRSDTIYTPLVTLRMFMQQVLSDDASCNAAVARFVVENAIEGNGEVSANSGPYCSARSRLPLEPLKTGVKASGEVIQKAAKNWQWHGLNVVLADGTTELMPDTEENQERYPQQPNQEKGLGFPIVRIVALISLATGAVLDYALAPYQGKGTGEASLLARLWDSLRKGDFLLADRYYATYGILARALRDNVEVLMQSHGKRRVDYRKGQRLGKHDHLTTWLKPASKPVWMSESEYAELPPQITVREFRVAGRDFCTTLVGRCQSITQKKHWRNFTSNAGASKWIFGA